MIKLTMTFYDSLGFDFSVHQCNLFGKCSRIALFISNRHALNLQKLERFNFKYDLNSFFIIHKGFFNEWMYSIQSMNVLQLNKILKFFGGGGGGGYFAWPHTSSANRLNKWLLGRRQLFPLSWIHFLSSRSRKLKVDELLSNW